MARREPSRGGILRAINRVVSECQGDADLCVRRSLVPPCRASGKVLAGYHSPCHVMLDCICVCIGSRFGLALCLNRWRADRCQYANSSLFYIVALYVCKRFYSTLMLFLTLLFASFNSMTSRVVRKSLRLSGSILRNGETERCYTPELLKAKSDSCDPWIRLPYYIMYCCEWGTR
jgi:hypothetical protein